MGVVARILSFTWRSTAKVASALALVVSSLLATGAPVRAESLPMESQASDTYVAISSPPEIVTVDSNSGSIVGSPVAVANAPVAESEWWTDVSSPAELVVAESNGSSGHVVQTVNPVTAAVSSAVSLAAAPTAVVVARDDFSQSTHYALVLEPSHDQVQVFDTEAGSLKGTVSLGLTNNDAMSIAVDQTGTYAYVADATAHKVVTLEFETTSPYFHVISTYAGSSSFDPSAITVAPSGATAYLSDGSSIDVANLASGVVSLSGSISLSSAAGSSAVNAAASELYVTLGSSVAVVALPAETVTYWSPPVASSEVAISNDGQVVGVGSPSSSTYDLLSAESGSVLNSVSLPGAPAAVLSAAGQSLHFDAFIVKSAKNEVDVYDPYANIGGQNITVGSDPVAVASTPDGRYVFVANKGGNSVSVIQSNLIDTNSNPVVQTIALGSGFSPDALAVNASGGQLLVAGKGSSTYAGQVVSFDADPNSSGFLSEVADITLSGTSPNPDSIAIMPDGQYAYVADAANNQVDVLHDSHTYSLVGTTGSVASTPEDLAISPNGETAYMTADPSGGGNGWVNYFTIGTNGQFGTKQSWAVGVAPQDISVSPQGTTAWVTNNTSNTVTQITLTGAQAGQETTVNSNSSSPPSLSGPYGAALTPDASYLMVTNNGSSGSTMSVYSEPGNSLVRTYGLTSSSSPGALVVLPTFDNPLDTTLINNEQDVNPAVAATGSLRVVDGVNTATAAYTLPLDDFSMPDIGTSLDLSQEYNSANTAVNEGLGNGWAFSYGMFATQSPPGTSSSACQLTITEQNGSTAVFYPPASGNWTSSCSGAGSSTEAYQPPSWEQASLSVVANCNGTDSCFDMTLGATTQYLFDESGGELVKEIDQNGKTTSLTYSGGVLSKVTGPSGNRSLAFTWSGDISSVTEMSATTSEDTASFTYSGSNLASVKIDASATGDTTTHTWAFSYATSSSNLTSWWSPVNSGGQLAADATQIAYLSSNRVSSVTDPQEPWSCSGGSGTCSPTWGFTWTAWEPDSGSGAVIITDPNEGASASNGNTTIDAYADGLLVNETKGYEQAGSSQPERSATTYSVADPFTWLPSLSIDGDGNETVDTYDSNGNVLQETDPMGHVTSYLYNRFNEVLLKTDPMGYTTSYVYDSHGNELSETDADGNTTSYAYTSTGLQCGKLAPDGYAAGDRMTSCPTSAAPYVTAYGYDAEGDQTSQTSYDGTNNTVSATYVTTTLYNGVGEVCASLTADGYAAGDRLPSSCPSTAAPYETVNSAYDAFGNALSVIAPSNSPAGTTTSTYDADGNELTTTDGAGDTTTKTWSPDDTLCWSSTLAVSGATCTSPPTGTGTATTSYAYDADANKVSTTSPDGNANPTTACLYETTSTFDNLGAAPSSSAVTGGTSCSNETVGTTTTTYDGDGNVLSETAPSGEVTSTGYNPDGEVCWTAVWTAAETGTCSSPPTSGEVTTTAYDADGNDISTTDPSGNTTTTAYDGDGKVCWSEPLAVSNPSCSSPPTGSGTYTTTDYYDADGNTVAVTAQSGDPATCNPLTTASCADTTYNSYDELGRQVSVTDPSGNDTSYVLDADGRVLTTTMPDSSTTTNTYNGAGQLIEVAYSDGTPSVSYQYSGNGERCWMLEGGASTASCSPGPAPSGSEVLTTYGYDSSGHLSSQSTESSGTTTTDTYSYDASGNLACVSYPNAAAGTTCSPTASGTGVLHYAYNGENEPTSVTDWAGDTLTLAYNTSGHACWVSSYAPSSPSCSSVPYQSGAVTTAYSYDGYGNVSELKTTTGTGPTTLLDLSVGSNRNADNFITAETPTVGSTTQPTDSYGYNNQNQVSSGPIVGTGSTSYSYNQTGGITADTTAFGSAAYTAAGELCWTYSGASSNSCSSPPTGATTYAYNSNGERTATTPASGNPESFGWESASGLMTCANTNGTSCSTSSPTSTTTVYAYNGDGLRSSSTIGGTTTSYDWGSLGSRPNLLSDGTWDYVYLPGSPSPIEQAAASGSSPAADLLLSDESGNTRGIVQLSSGTHNDQLVNYTDYDSYGDPITKSGGSSEVGGLTTPQTSINANYVGSTPWGFGEGYTDATGLVYLVHRYYEPATGQFTSLDPLVTVTSQPYGFAQDNALAYQDPSGQIVQCHATSHFERKPKNCDIWIDSYKAMQKLGVTPSSGGYVEVDGVYVWGPLLDLMNHVWNAKPKVIVRYLVFGLHLLQDNQYHNRNYDPWFNSDQVAPVNEFVEYCGQVTNQCLPPPDDVTTPPAAGGVWYLCYANQHAGTTPVSAAELDAFVKFTDAVEWGGSIMELIGQ